MLLYVWAFGLPLILLFVGGFIKGLAEGDPFAIKGYNMSLELCVAGLVEAISSLIELCGMDVLPGKHLAVVVALIFLEAFLLFVVTVIYNRVTKSQSVKPTTLTALSVLGNGIGVGILGVSLLNRGLHV